MKFILQSYVLLVPVSCFEYWNNSRVLYFSSCFEVDIKQLFSCNICEYNYINVVTLEWFRALFFRVWSHLCYIKMQLDFRFFLKKKISSQILLVPYFVNLTETNQAQRFSNPYLI